MLRRRGHVTVKVKAEYVALVTVMNEGDKNREEKVLLSSLLYSEGFLISLSRMEEEALPPVKRP